MQIVGYFHYFFTIEKAYDNDDVFILFLYVNE